MHGKSCFNFPAIVEPYFEELAALTSAGFDSYRRQGFVPVDATAVESVNRTAVVRLR